jgi:dCMP deaminase
MNKWDKRWLEAAAFFAAWSKDPSTKVGAVIVRPDNTMASHGYNGFPRGVNDDPARYADRAQKYPRTVHAEVNAILSAHERVAGYTLYLTPLFPCAGCAGAVIQAGIKRVVVAGPQAPTRWLQELEIGKEMFSEASVSIEWEFQDWANRTAAEQGAA